MLTQVWKLTGLMGSEPRHLEMRAGRLIYTPTDRLTPGFDVPVSEVTEVNFPWHYFGGGFKMRIGSEQHRFSFVEPHKVAADISGGREAGKAWKKILAK